MGGEGNGRYRMQKHIRLPRFMSPRNPFKPEPSLETPGLPAAMPDGTGAAAGAAPPAIKVSFWTHFGAGLRQCGLFCLEHNSFSRIGQAMLPAIPRFGKPRVQGELSLDKVKVVRGDLTHADLEVVHMGSGGNQATSPGRKELPARIFGAGLK